jgi:hypothetical protein
MDESDRNHPDKKKIIIQKKKKEIQVVVRRLVLRPILRDCGKTSNSHATIHRAGAATDGMKKKTKKSTTHSTPPFSLSICE